MTEDLHERASRMISVEQVEGLTPEDRTWLSGHLSVCPGCLAKAEALGRALSSLRSVSVRLDPSLVAATRRRVRSRAAALEEQRGQLAAVLFVVMLSVAWMAITGPLTWRAFEWLGRSLGWADGVWQGLLFLAWFLPATLVALVVPLMRRRSFDRLNN